MVSKLDRYSKTADKDNWAKLEIIQASMAVKSQKSALQSHNSGELMFFLNIQKYKNLEFYLRLKSDRN